MSYYEHYYLEDEFNDTGSASGDLDGSGYLDLDEPCDMEPLLTRDSQQVLLPVVYALIFTLGITSNGLVVMVVGCQRSKRSLTDRYRLHLSAADILFLLVLPFWAVDAALAEWRFGLVTCVCVHVIYTINLYCSVLILAFISLDRYLAVVRATGTGSRDLRQLLVHKLVYVGAWLPAGLLAVPDLLFARTQTANDGRIMCRHFYPENNAVTVWVAAFHLQLVLVGLVMPGLVMLVCYCVIISRVTRGPLAGQRQTRRAARTTMTLVLCFLLCWLPYGAGISIDALKRLEVLPRNCRLELVLELWLSLNKPIAYFHCCLNPLLYAFLGAKFKTSALSVLSLTWTFT